MKHEIISIAALGLKNRAIGRDKDLIWKIPDDLKWFKKQTDGHPIIMGLVTYESIGRILPGRTNIVMTRGQECVQGAKMAHSVADALEIAKQSPGSEKVFVVGGGQIYKLFMPHVDTLMLALFEEEKPGDVFFPEYEHDFTAVGTPEEHSYNNVRYYYQTFRRRGTLLERFYEIISWKTKKQTPANQSPNLAYICNDTVRV
jgi:dihydrofolate reductase